MKGGIKIIGIITICIILFSIGFSGCFEDEQKEAKLNYIYEFTINFNNKSDAILFIPIPILNEEVIEFDYSINSIIEGNAELKINNSIYGDCLEIKVNSSKNIVFKSVIKMSKKDEFLKSQLSMYSETLPNKVEYYCWIYYEGSLNATFTLKYHEEYAINGHIIGPTSHDYPIEHELQKGWHKVLVDNRIPE